MQKGYQIEFFMEQNERRENSLLYEWLIKVAQEHGMNGATAFIGAMGFGEHNQIHSAHFFELLDQPVVVLMIGSDNQVDKLLSFLEKEKVDLFYVKLPAEFARLGSEKNRNPAK